MIIGIPKEIKTDENRVALTPDGVRKLINDSHEVIIEKGAGLQSSITDDEYIQAGAKIASHAREIYSADFIIKVKEPTEEEYLLLKNEQILFCYLHLAPNKQLTQALVNSGCIAISYETVEKEDGSLPLLSPMSEIAGRMATQVGAQFLENIHGGRGILLGGATGVAPARVTIIGSGVVGTNALAIAKGMRASLMVIDKDEEHLTYLSRASMGTTGVCISSPENIAVEIAKTDLLIGAAMVVGAKAPLLVSQDMVRSMKKGSVIVDVAIDQGGNIETSMPTTHSNPIIKVHDVLHYAVTNIPSIVSNTSTYALTNATIDWVLEIANKGWLSAIRENKALAKGLNIIKGKVVYKEIAQAHNMPYSNIEQFLKKAV